MNKLDFVRRPLSWSAISSFEYDPEQWARKYIDGIEPEGNKEMVFGKLLAESIENGKPMVPVTVYKKVEYPLEVVFNKIPLIGYCDSYEPHSKLIEYKTGKKAWDQERVDQHGQLTMYCLMLYIQHKVKPEDLDVKLQWIPTYEDGDFSIQFIKPIKIHTFQTKRTLSDILKFGARINQTVVSMQSYVSSRSIALDKLEDKVIITK